MSTVNNQTEFQQYILQNKKPEREDIFHPNQLISDYAIKFFQKQKLPEVDRVELIKELNDKYNSKQAKDDRKAEAKRFKQIKDKPRFSTLKQENFPRKTQEYVDNYEYMNKLSKEDQMWLQCFNDAYYANNTKSNQKYIPEIKRIKKVASDMCNARNRDLLSLHKATQSLYCFEESILNDSLEIRPIEQLDYLEQLKMNMDEKETELETERANLKTVAENLIKDTVEALYGTEILDKINTNHYKLISRELLHFYTQMNKVLKTQKKYIKELEKGKK